MAEEGSYDLMVNGEEIGMPLRQLNHNGGGAAMPNSKGSNIYHQRTQKSRIVPRQPTWHPGYGRMNIDRRGSLLIPKLSDLFHSIAGHGTWFLLGLVAVAYVLVALIWAAFFYAARTSCGLEITTFLDAFYLSIETLATIGYGVPDQYLNGCLSGAFIITTEYIISIFLDAVCIGIIFVRLSRPGTRRHTIQFSKRAIVQNIRGQLCFMFQVCDMSRMQILEAKTRCYAVRHVRRPDGRMTYFQSFNMRLQHPDDELGAYVLLSLPSLIVHRIDAWSPLVPLSPDAEKTSCSQYVFPDVQQRANDFETGNREDAAHKDGGSLTNLDEEQIKAFWEDSRLEIICLLEGMEELTGCNLQARFSYTTADIDWNAEFVPCVSEGVKGQCRIDFDAFHRTQPASLPYNETTVPSHA